ncbi:hypothetical protein, partial [Bradyrhizobium neotropicale]|uniref:hypothetical protein n=1 Tax=Bradyrhizobium neotropicale TaxID=1497615 RepID=UPI001AD6557C
GIAKIKLQALGASWTKSWQSQMPLCPENRLPLKDLGDSSRSTRYRRRQFSSLRRRHFAGKVGVAAAGLDEKRFRQTTTNQFSSQLSDSNYQPNAELSAHN